MKYQGIRVNLLSLIICAAGVFGAAQGFGRSTTYNAPFSYRAIVTVDGSPCASKAEKMNSTFEALTGLQATSVCKDRQTIVDGGTTYQTDTVIINYSSDRELYPIRAVFGGTETMGVPSEYKGLFKTYGQCVSQIPSQIENFQVETGLAPIAAHCSSSLDSFYGGYSLVIESFGRSQRDLYSFAVTDDSLNGVETPSNADTLATSKAALTQAGAEVVYEDSSHLFYYAQSPIVLTRETLGTYPLASQCLDQKVEAQKIFLNAGLIGATALCENVSTANDSYVSLKVIGAGLMENLNETTGQARYSTYSECLGDAARVAQNHSSMGENVLGTLCEPSYLNDQNYLVHVFSNGY